MTSSNYMKYELGVSEDQIQNPFGIIFQFGVIWILFKSFLNTKMISNSFSPHFTLKGIILPLFPFILFLEKNNLNKIQLTQN